MADAASPVKPRVGVQAGELRPATWAGGQLVKRALRRKEDAEDRGGRTDPATLRVAALDPTSFVDRGERPT